MKISVFCLLLGLCLGPLSAEIIDRIAITVANQVITESTTRSRIATMCGWTRLVSTVRSWTKRAITSVVCESANPQAVDASAALAGIKATYPNQADFAAALESYGISEADLTGRLLWQFTLLRFIDYRFRPGIQIPDADVQTYYRQQVSGWEQQGIKPIPTLEDSRDQIEEILTQKKIDQALDQWMAETRKQVPVTYHDATLAGRDAGKE